MVLWFFHLSQWPPTSKDFYTRSYPLHFCPILILQREPVFLFLMLSFTTGTIFITSLVWHGPWLGIEPGTSRTRRRPSSTRLSRRFHYHKCQLNQHNIHSYLSGQFRKKIVIENGRGVPNVQLILFPNCF